MITLKDKGFTLIELLVVISIISILASVILVSISAARAKARDVQRMSDIHQIQLALEEYATDHGGDYPNNGCTFGSSTCSFRDTSANVPPWSGFLATALIPYIPSGLKLSDPTPDAEHLYAYIYSLDYANMRWGAGISTQCNGHILLVAWGMETQTAASPGNNIGCTVNNSKAIVYVIQ